MTIRIFISVDMEGIGGITTVRQTTRGTDDYPWARQLMTQETNAAIAGAADVGALKIVVSDSHGDMGNILPLELDPRAELVQGTPKLPWSMMTGIEEGFTGCVFIGYHAGAGTASAILDRRAPLGSCVRDQDRLRSDVGPLEIAEDRARRDASARRRIGEERGQGAGVEARRTVRVGGVAHVERARRHAGDRSRSGKNQSPLGEVRMPGHPHDVPDAADLAEPRAPRRSPHAGRVSLTTPRS
jgi:hypothetical protein